MLLTRTLHTFDTAGFWLQLSDVTAKGRTQLIDYLAIGLTHGLIAYIAIRLLVRDDLDDETAFEMPEPEPLFKKRKRRNRHAQTGQDDA